MQIARTIGSRGVRPAIALVCAALALSLCVAIVAASRASAATTRRPTCTRSALQAGLGRGTEKVRHAKIGRPFGCDGDWAYAAVNTRRFTFTAVFQARSGRWETVNRTRPCARREVPRRIRRAACDSN